MKTFEEKLKELTDLMAKDPMSEDVLPLAKELKESCTTESERQMLDDFVACGINKLSTDVEQLYHEVIQLANC